MAIIVTPGYRFDQDEKVTPTKLNNLVDLATLRNIASADVITGPVRPPYYGSIAPAITIAQIWYDTTPGYEGLKYAYVSASNASISKWLYRTPHWDGIFWADSGATLGVPQAIYANQNQAFGLLVQRFDGCAYPRIQPPLPASSPTGGESCVWVIPTESVGASRPCVATIMGLSPGVFVANITGAGHVFASAFTPPSLRTFGPGTAPVTRSYVLGTLAAPVGGIPGVTLASWLFLGVMHADNK